MNPLTNVKNIIKLNEIELEKGTIDKKSWHDIYKDSAWVFIGGLSYGLTEGDVLCVFSQYGEIVNINLVRDKKTGKIKGFCFLCYANQKSTVLAVDNLNGIKLCGRTIRVDHVSNYKPPKDHEDEDDLTKQLKAEGCAPKPIKVEQPDDVVPPRKKTKKDKKKHKKKEKKEKKKRSTSSTEVRIKKEKVDPGYDKYALPSQSHLNSSSNKKRHEESSSSQSSSIDSTDEDEESHTPRKNRIYPRNTISKTRHFDGNNRDSERNKHALDRSPKHLPSSFNRSDYSMKHAQEKNSTSRPRKKSPESSTSEECSKDMVRKSRKKTSDIYSERRFDFVSGAKGRQHSADGGKHKDKNFQKNRIARNEDSARIYSYSGEYDKNKNVNVRRHDSSSSCEDDRRLTLKNRPNNKNKNKDVRRHDSSPSYENERRLSMVNKDQNKTVKRRHDSSSSCEDGRRLSLANRHNDKKKDINVRLRRSSSSCDDDGRLSSVRKHCEKNKDRSSNNEYNHNRSHYDKDGGHKRRRHDSSSSCEENNKHHSNTSDSSKGHSGKRTYKGMDNNRYAENKNDGHHETSRSGRLAKHDDSDRDSRRKR